MTRSTDSMPRRGFNRPDKGRLEPLNLNSSETMQTFCSECGGTMQMGYLADRGDSSVAMQSFWVEGEPEMSKFLGMNAGLKIKDRARFDVVTMRCEKCGMLKSYARPEDRCDKPGE